jgi:hypothetical protein
MNDIVNAVEAEVVKAVEGAEKAAAEVKEVVLSEAEKLKASVLAQQADFMKQLDAVRKDMVSLQQQFEAKKSHALKLEGAKESLDILLKSLS